MTYQVNSTQSIIYIRFRLLAEHIFYPACYFNLCTDGTVYTQYQASIKNATENENVIDAHESINSIWEMSIFHK